MAGVYSVSQVNAYIKNMFAQDFALNRISVKGEVSNCKYHTSGHIYFTLKDGLGAMQAVMFASRRKGLTFRLEEGQQVVVKGSIEVYERDGRYQLYASEITLDGTGDLFRRFEKLRNELEEMGMFSPEYKTPIPKYAKTVGIVTASTGAAIRDIINISGRRNPYVQLVLCPALVQGAGAAPSIVRAIQTLDALHLDVLIVGRGGGSIEDLWAFNEESVARAIFASTIPVVSAVGHEPDVTISDFVADVRAATPSNAAELVAPDQNDLRAYLLTAQKRMAQAMQKQVKLDRKTLDSLRSRRVLQSPINYVNEKRLLLDHSAQRLGAAMQRNQEAQKRRFIHLTAKLDALSPLKVLARGYSVVLTEDGRVVQRAEQVSVGQQVDIKLSEGSITASVLGTQEERHGKEITEL